MLAMIAKAFRARKAITLTMKSAWPWRMNEREEGQNGIGRHRKREGMRFGLEQITQRRQAALQDHLFPGVFLRQLPRLGSGLCKRFRGQCRSGSCGGQN